jgi:hypothetical protein
MRSRLRLAFRRLNSTFLVQQLRQRYNTIITHDSWLLCRWVTATHSNCRTKPINTKLPLGFQEEWPRQCDFNSQELDHPQHPLKHDVATCHVSITCRLVLRHHRAEWRNDDSSSWASVSHRLMLSISVWCEREHSVRTAAIRWRICNIHAETRVSMDTVRFIGMRKSSNESAADVNISIVQITGRFQEHGKETCKAKWTDFFKSCGFINELHNSSFRGTHMWPIIRENYMLFNPRPFHASHCLPLFIVFNKRTLVYCRWLYYLHQLVLLVYTLIRPSNYILNVRFRM